MTLLLRDRKWMFLYLFDICVNTFSLVQSLYVFPLIIIIKVVGLLLSIYLYLRSCFWSFLGLLVKNKSDCWLSEPFIVRNPFRCELDSLMCLWTWVPPPQKTMNSEPPSVKCKWVLKNWHSHLGSTSHPSQTNEVSSASKWDWSPFETRRRTLGFWILRKVPLSMETLCGLTLHPPSHPPLEWCRNRDPVRTFFFFFPQLHQYSLIHRESWQQILNCITGWMFPFVTLRSVENGILN